MRNVSPYFEQGEARRLRYLGTETEEDGSPTLFATDRTDRKTYIIRGWEVTDSQALADAGMNPTGEGLLEVPAELFRFLEEGSR